MIRFHRLRLIEFHAAALLLGLTGLFGKFLHISPLMIVLGRAAFAAVYQACRFSGQFARR